MATPPLTPPEQETRRFQQELDELVHRWEELRRQAAGPYFPGGIASARLASPTADIPASLSLSTGLTPASVVTGSVVPGWLSPILQGITILVLFGAIFWVGQTVGTINAKLDNLQKTVDKFGDWKESSSVTLGQLNTKVDTLTSKIDDLSKKK